MCPSTSQVSMPSRVTAQSRDGRTFTFGATGGPSYGPGDMVVVRAEDVTVLGQVLEVGEPPSSGASADEPATTVGTGMVIGTLDADGVLRRAYVRPSPPRP